MSPPTKIKPELFSMGYAPAVFGAALILAALAFTVPARLQSDTAMRHAPSVVVDSRQILFEDRADGTLAIYDAGAKDPFEIIAPDKSGFIRGTTRALRHGRRVNRATDSTPYELIRWADGRFSLRDTADGREIPLEAFGSTNFEDFRRIMMLGRPGQKTANVTAPGIDARNHPNAGAKP